MESTNKSSVVPLSSGTTIQHSVLVAAAPCSTTDAKPNYEHIVVILTILLKHLFHQTLCPDLMWLATNSAKDELTGLGFTEEEVDKTLQTLIRHWRKERNANPLSCLF